MSDFKNYVNMDAFLADFREQANEYLDANGKKLISRFHYHEELNKLWIQWAYYVPRWQRGKLETAILEQLTTKFWLVPIELFDSRRDYLEGFKIVHSVDGDMVSDCSYEIVNDIFYKYSKVSAGDGGWDEMKNDTYLTIEQIVEFGFYPSIAAFIDDLSKDHVGKFEFFEQDGTYYFAVWSLTGRSGENCLATVLKDELKWLREEIHNGRLRL